MLGRTGELQRKAGGERRGAHRLYQREKYAAEFRKDPADIGDDHGGLFSRIKAPSSWTSVTDIPFIPHVDAVPGKSDGYIPHLYPLPLDG